MCIIPIPRRSSSSPAFPSQRVQATTVQRRPTAPIFSTRILLIDFFDSIYLYTPSRNAFSVNGAGWHLQGEQEPETKASHIPMIYSRSRETPPLSLLFLFCPLFFPALIFTYLLVFYCLYNSIYSIGGFRTVFFLFFGLCILPTFESKWSSSCGSPGRGDLLVQGKGRDIRWGT